MHLEECKFANKNPILVLASQTCKRKWHDGFEDLKFLCIEILWEGDKFSYFFSKRRGLVFLHEKVWVGKILVWGSYKKTEKKAINYFHSQ